jgi:hypothetical protein
MISLAYLLSYGVVPTISIAMIQIQWDPIAGGTVKPLVYLIGIGFLVSMSTVAFAIAAFVVLRRQKSGLYHSPASLAGLGALIAQSDLLQRFQSLHSFETQEGIDRILGSLRLGLLHTGASRQTSIQVLNPDQAIQKAQDTAWQRDPNEAHPWWLRGRTYLGLNGLMLIPTIVLYAVIFQQSYAAVSDSDPLEINGNAFAIKVCTAILALVGAAFYANWHLNVAILQPYYKLAQFSDGKLRGSSSALRMDFSGSPLFNLLRPGQSFDVWLMAVCALLTQLAVIIRPAVFQNLGFITALTLRDNSDPEISGTFANINVPAGVAPLKIVSNVFDGIYAFFALFGLLLVLTRKRKPFLPRKPYTLSSQILYLCHGADLLEDLKGMSMLSKKARDTRLKQQRHKYALGWVGHEAKTCSFVGIDRLENIGRQFQYPKADSNDVERKRSNRATYERLHPGTDAGWPDNAQ